MKTLFEQHMDLFSKTVRLQIEDWIHVGTANTGQDNDRRFFHSRYNIKPPINTIRGKTDIIEVTMGVHTQNKTLTFSIWGVIGDKNNPIGTVGYNLENLGVNMVSNNLTKKDLEDNTNTIAWNKKIGLPIDMIEHIIGELQKVFKMALDE